MKNKIIWTTLICLMILATIQGASAVNLTLGHLSYYTFDTANSTIAPLMDEWYKLKNVTGNVNQPTWNQTGINNEAWDFEFSNAEYSIIDSDVNEYTTEVNTVCAWFNMDATKCPDPTACTIWKGDDNRTSIVLRVEDNDKLEWFYYSTGANGLCMYNKVLNAGQWYYGCLVYNISDAGNEMKVYLNGTLGTQCADAGALNSKQNQNRFSHALQEWDGLIDEVSIWSRPLSPAEISALWNSGAGNFSFFKGGAPPTNFTINLTSTNSRQINTGNCTVNGTNYATTNGTITTIIDSSTGALVNITCYSLGFQTYTNNNYNVSVSPLNTALNQSPFTNISSGVTGVSRVGSNLILNCTYTNPYNFSTTINYTLVNTIDTLGIHNGTNSTYTIANTDLFDNMTLACTICSIYRCDSNAPAQIIYADLIDATITYNLNGFGGTPIASLNTVQTNNSVNQNGNPYLGLASTFINSTQRSLAWLFIFTDLNGYHAPLNISLTINETLLTQTLNMTPYRLVLNFSNTTSGVIRAGLDTGGWNWTNQSIVIFQGALSNGEVHVTFNQIGANWTQHYEYINNYSYMQDNIQLLNTANTFAYIQVLDMGNSPLPEAIIRAYQLTPTLGVPENYSLVQQRLTDEDGYVYLQFDLDSHILITIQKDGYELVDGMLTLTDMFQVDQSDAKIFRMLNSESVTTGTALYYTPARFQDRTQNILGFVYAPNKQSVEVTTTYRISQGLGNYTLISDTLDRYMIQFIAGVDFLTTGNTNITTLLYIDGIYDQNTTIIYRPYTTTEILPQSTLTPLDQNYTIFILGIGLILISSLIGIVIKSPTSSYTIFMIGTIIIAFINTAFINLAIIGLIYFTMRGLHKITTE